jgi:RNase H-like domain found in reverse transcriptase
VIHHHYHPTPNNYNKRFVVETDTSDQAIGAILSQIQDDGKLHPVAYYSHTLNDAERNYDAPKKELLAVVKAFEHWQHHILGVTQPTIVLMDQANLQYY